MRTVLVTLLLLLSTGVAAQPPADEPLRVLLRVAPPFVIDEGDGEFSGISVDLWRGIAEDRQVPYEFEVVGLDTMLDVVAAGGGCFSNPWLRRGFHVRARETGRRLALNESIPAGDSGLAVGQLWIAARRAAC